MATDTISQLPVEKEYEKNTQITPEDIRNLREWLNRQPHLPSDHITDLDLILAFHYCDRSAEVAKQVVDLNFTLKTLFTPLFQNREINKKVEKAMHIVLLSLLPLPSFDGSRVMYTKIIDSNLKDFNFADIVRSCMMIFDLWQCEEGTWPGSIIIIDMAGFQIGHLSKLDLMTVQQYLYFLQEAMFINLKGYHFTNAPSFMDKLLMILRPFMKKELQDLIRIHPIGSDSIYEVVPRKAFPKDAGGENKPLDELRDESWNKVKNNKKFFADENKKRVQESLRPGKPKTLGTVFGIEGSFKKLDID